MNEKIYRQLQNEFILVRHLHTEDYFDEERFYRVIEDIQNAHRKLAKANDADTQFLLYLLQNSLFKGMCDQYIDALIAEINMAGG